jgi:hypothetical protein
MSIRTDAHPPGVHLASAAVIASNGVTIAGVLAFGWDGPFVLLVTALGLSASAFGLAATIALHHRTTGDPAHLSPQFTGWLRMRGEGPKPFAQAVQDRTAWFPAALAVFLLLWVIAQASAPLHAAWFPMLSMTAVALLSHAETAGLRRSITRVPFAQLRQLGFAMVYREAVLFGLFFAGLAAWRMLRLPLPHVIAAALLLKTGVEVVLIQQSRRRP